MKIYDITLLTDSRYVNPANPNQYVQNILAEDGLVRQALEKKGLRVTRVDWADPNFDWSSTGAALFRTTWDYFHRFNEFMRWLDRASTQTQFINPVELIRWNVDKHYLRDLQNKEIHIPQTIFVEQGETITLKELHRTTGWKETVLKPAVSGGGRHTYRLNEKNFSLYENIFQEMISNEAMMLQPFLPNVITHGEIALMVIGGKFTHAILKRARSGDFRVQDDFGGTVHSYQPANDEITFAEHVVSVCSPTPTYARVDVILDDDKRLAVSELELIEPEMWLRFFPTAAERLAEMIVKFT